MDEILQSNTSTSTAPSAGTNNSSNTGSEVPIIGTNNTVNIVGDQESVNNILETLNSRTEPVLVGANTTIQIDTTKSEQSQQSGEDTSSSGQAPRTDSDPNYEYTFSGGGDSVTGDSNTSSGDGGPIVDTNASISDSGIPAGDSSNPFAGGFGSDTSSSESSDPLTGGADAAGGGSPFPGGGNPFNTPQNDENYQWNFMEETSGEGDMEALFKSSPWGQLSEVGITSFQQIFSDDPTLAEGNPFGGNPMGGGNSFASGSASVGGGNPMGGGSPISGDAPLTSGDAPSDASTYTWDV